MTKQRLPVVEDTCNSIGHGANGIQLHQCCLNVRDQKRIQVTANIIRGAMLNERGLHGGKWIADGWLQHHKSSNHKSTYT